MAGSDPEERALNQGLPSSAGGALEIGAAQVADEALAAAAVEDRSAYIELYRRHVNRVYSYFTWRFGRTFADDLTSETFVRTLNSLRRFDPRRSWKAWLFGVARHVASEHVRRQLHERKTSLEADMLPTGQLPDEGQNPEDAALDSERVMLARTLVASLKANEQELVALRFWAGLSYREAGAVIGISEGATRVRVHRLLQKLRRRMEARS